MSEELLVSQLVDLQNRVQELEGIKDPTNLRGQIADAFRQIDEIISQQSIVMQKLRAYAIDSKYVELFTDDEIRKFYENSGVSMNDVKTFIEKVVKNDGRPLSLVSASKYVNGEIKDIMARSMVGKYLREQAVLNKGK